MFQLKMCLSAKSLVHKNMKGGIWLKLAIFKAEQGADNHNLKPFDLKDCNKTAQIRCEAKTIFLRLKLNEY